MRIALAQTAPKLGAVAANLEQIEQQLALAGERGAEFAVFPELALTGYRLRDLVPQVALRLDRSSPTLDRLAAASRRLPFLVGLVEESPEHLFYNSAAWFEAGELRFTHRKCFLANYGLFDEAMDFARGERLRAFDTAFGRFGVLICEDSWHPSAASVLTQDRATLLLVISVSPLRGLAARPGEDSATLWQRVLETTARLATVPVAYVGRCGVEDGLSYAGGSYLIGPGGERISEPMGLESGLSIVTLDVTRTRTARAGAPLLRDERPELIARELERIVSERAGLPQSERAVRSDRPVGEEAQ